MQTDLSFSIFSIHTIFKTYPHIAYWLSDAKVVRVCAKSIQPSPMSTFWRGVRGIYVPSISLCLLRNLSSFIWTVQKMVRMVFLQNYLD